MNKKQLRKTEMSFVLRFHIYSIIHNKRSNLEYLSNRNVAELKYNRNKFLKIIKSFCGNEKDRQKLKEEIFNVVYTG